MSDKMTVKVKVKLPMPERKLTVANSGHRSTHSDWSKAQRKAKRGGSRG